MIRLILKKLIYFILQIETRLVLFKYKPKIIAVTGSVGKTGTKDAIYTVMSEHFYAHRSIKSYNSEIGVPLTILNAETGWNNIILWIKNILSGLALIFLKNHYPKWLVIEAGVDRPGDMKRLTKWIKPDIAVFTRFSDPPPHVEFFRDKEELYKEKWELALSVKKGGTIIVNEDDKNLRHYAHEVADKSVITFGISDKSKIRASNILIQYRNQIPKGFTFKAEYEGNSVPIKINNTIGESFVYNALAAIAVGVSEDLNLISISESLSLYETPPGRLRIISGVKKSTIIDDTYNSSPEALDLAIKTLEGIEGEGRKILVLGDMLELGSHTLESHKKVGENISEMINMLYVVGPRAKYIGDAVKRGVIKRKNIFYFDDATLAGKHLQNKIIEGDTILIKGSQGIRLERTVEEVMAHPEKKMNILVRQEEEWSKR